MRKATIILLVIALLAFLGYHATGTRLRGNATTATDIPIVGDDLSEIHFLTTASYRGFEHPHGGGSVTLSGSATKESLDGFCREADVTMSHNGTDILDRQLILQQLAHFNMLEDRINETNETLVLGGMGGRFRKLFGTFDPTTKRFHIYLQFDGTK